MMLELVRRWHTAHATIGELSIDGRFEAFTLEDVERPAGVKIPGQTAIPRGSYEVTINQSVRFGRQMPLLRGVPGFAGVRIHAGNTHEDTEGCILVGDFREADRILRSRHAFDRLFQKISAELGAGRLVSILVRGEGA